MAETELSILLTLKDSATAQLKQINAELVQNKNNWQQNFAAIATEAKRTALIMAGMSATIFGALGMAYKASEEERLSIALLTNNLKNVSVAYDDVRESIEKKIEATRRTTGISDEEQRGALSQLILTTQSYDKAVRLLPLALDLAKAKQMDTTTAAMLLGRVAEGNINALNRYGFAMEGVKDPAQALDEIQKRVKGSAQAMVSPLELLKSDMDELAETIGKALTPALIGVVNQIRPIIDAIKEWSDKNPELLTQLIDVAIAIAGGMGVTAAVLGLAVAFALLGGPVTLALIFLSLLVAAGIWFALNWKAFGLGWGIVWGDMKESAIQNINVIIDGINFLLKGINAIGRVFGQNWNIAIPKIGSTMGPPEGYTYKPGGTYGPPVTAPGGNAPVTPGNWWGNYGNTGRTGEFGNIIVNIAGSVVTEKEIAEIIRQQLLLLQKRNYNTGIQ